jgi:hypothetical protein
MLASLKKALRWYMDIYGAAEPGSGVTVYTGVDSVSDFYRMRGGRLPLSEVRAPKPRKRARVSLWGGNGAAHIVSFGPKRAGC